MLQLVGISDRFAQVLAFHDLYYLCVMNNICNFSKDTTLSAVLYIVENYGGTSDMHKIFKTLYFADKEHLARFGRSITRDSYIAMNYGPVPSKTDDIFKAVRGDSFFSDSAEDLKKYFSFVNKYTIKALQKPNMDYLSQSDVECLDNAIRLCKPLNFGQLTDLSHGLAWQNTQADRTISVKDILREAGETEEYAEYISREIQLESYGTTLL